MALMKGIFRLCSVAIIIAIALLLILWIVDVLPQGGTQEVFIDTLLVIIVSSSAVGLIGLMMRHK